MSEVRARLDVLRGSGKRKGIDARAISALAANPACQRRGVLDAAGINKRDLAAAIKFPTPADQSQFAITRGRAFEAQVKANGCAQLLTLLRGVLGLGLPEVSYDDLENVGGSEISKARSRHTARLLTQAGRGGGEAGTLFDHPLLRLDIAGYPVFLEPDLVAFQHAGKFHVVEIKSFAIIDGHAPAATVAAAEIQAAVYVYALREMLKEEGIEESIVSPQVILVCPENFSNKPTAVQVDITNQLAAVRRQLTRMRRLDEIVDHLPPGTTLDRWRDEKQLSPRTPDELVRTLRAVEARYIPQCLSSCEMAKFCRSEERGSTAALGRHVREELGGLETVSEVIGLAMGSRLPAEDQTEQARLLRLALRYRTDFLGGAA